ncbi:hypothetical protein D3C72_1784930 [compost metagenome]
MSMDRTWRPGCSGPCSAWHAWPTPCAWASAWAARAGPSGISSTWALAGRPSVWTWHAPRLSITRTRRCASVSCPTWMRRTSSRPRKTWTLAKPCSSCAPSPGTRQRPGITRPLRAPGAWQPCRTTPRLPRISWGLPAIVMPRSNRASCPTACLISGTGSTDAIRCARRWASR